MATNFDRQSLRALAERDNEEMQACINAGGNPYQLSLDQTDRFEASIQHLPEAEATAARELMAQEVQAITSANEARAAQLQVKAAEMRVKAIEQSAGKPWQHVVLTIILILGAYAFIQNRLG